jgi:Periplasmic binding protein
VSCFGTPSKAQKVYDTGASEIEIKIGDIMPPSGPASGYATIGKTEEAYFRKINTEGGINGRKVTFIFYDDAYGPPKAIEQARKLAESDEVLLRLGTSSKWGDPEHFPWTMGWQSNYQSEGRIYAKYVLDNYPNGKIAVLWQNDDAGKDLFKDLKDGLGHKASMIVADKSNEVSDPTIDSQIVALHDSGADIFGKLSWKPLFFLPNSRRPLAPYSSPRALNTQYYLYRLSKGSDRSKVEGRSRHQEMAGGHGQVLSGRRQNQLQQCLRLRVGTEPGTGAHAVRRRADPQAQERRETGGQSQGFLHRHDAAGHQGKYRPRRFLSDRADATDEI